LTKGAVSAADAAAAEAGMKAFSAEELAGLRQDWASTA